MKVALPLICVCLAVAVKGWGGHYNRKQQSETFDPNPRYYNYLEESPYVVEEPRYVSESLEAEAEEPIQEILKHELEELAEESCYERKCTSNMNCCEGSICADTKVGVTGRCVPIFGKKHGEPCYRDSDCESGFLCLESNRGRKCLEPMPGKGKFGEECSESSDCNITAGLCCRLIRKQKQHHKKLCSYFTDPEVCVGAVAVNQVAADIDYTSEEKREFSHPDHEYLKYRR